jgi:hypothetical protein
MRPKVNKRKDTWNGYTPFNPMSYCSLGICGIEVKAIWYAKKILHQQQLFSEANYTLTLAVTPCRDMFVTQKLTLLSG